MSADAPARVDGDDRLRLFCALRLDDGVLDRLADWQRDAIPRRPGVRPVARESLHLTLAFLGHRPAAELDAVVAELRAAAAAARPLRLELTGYRETRSVGMLVFADGDGAAGDLAADLHGRLERLGVYEPEQQRFLPHVTVVSPLPELGPVVPSDAAAYLSRLRPGGAQYEVLESVKLGG